MLRAFLLLLLFTPLFADEEIVVRLSAKESLNSLYLAPVQEKESGFDKSYVASLEKVLRFDFENDGKTQLTNNAKISPKVDVEIKQKNLLLKLVTGPSVKTLEKIPLTGELARDRRILHRLHDAIFLVLYGSDGIADSRILYTVKTRKGATSEDWTSEVWEADYDGANPRQITHDNCLCATPAFVPAEGAARHFVYVSYKAGQPKMYAASLETGAGKRMSFLRGNQLMPTIAPSLDKAAFICDITGNPDLFIQDFSPIEGLKGKPRQIFCAPGAAQGSPAFHPFKNQIAFVSNKDGTPRIYLLNIPPIGASVNDLKPTIITKKTRENTSPAWSPDGTKIAYSALAGGTRQIWIYDLASGEEIQLTDGYGHKENPAWAADSLHLVFNSSTSATSDLFMINLNQKKAVKISSGPGEKRFPSWEQKHLTERK